MGTLMNNVLNHTDDLFRDRKTPHITKSHCFICHKKLTLINKEVRGNSCSTCNNRAAKVGRGLLTEKESDFLLKYELRDLEEEVWNIDGVDYIKSPNGELHARD